MGDVRVTPGPPGYQWSEAANWAPEALLSPGWDGHPDTPRERIFLSVRDAAGLDAVHAVLRSFAGPSEGGSIRPTFSIDGSLITSISGVTLQSYVISPAQPHPAGDVSLYRDMIVDAVAKELGGLENGDRFRVQAEERVGASIFHSLGELGLFGSRQFHEFRFGVLADPVDSDFAPPALTSVLRDFLTQVTAAGAPIAYIFFPHRWQHDGRDWSPGAAAENVRWLRVAVGLRGDAKSLTNLQINAHLIAHNHSAFLYMYNAQSRRPLMSQRFELSHIPEDVGRTARDVRTPPAGGQQVDFVLCEGIGRVGYVASMLDGLPEGTSLLGGSMAVLHGHTVASWLMPAGTGDDLRKHIDGLNSTFYRSSVVAESNASWVHKLPVKTTRSPGASSDADRKALWIAWRCGDSPGVMAAVVNALAAQLLPLDASSADLAVEYGCSRVLADGITCAGKIKVAGDGTLIDGLLDGRERLELALRKALRPHLIEWDSEVKAWTDEPVVVEALEPAEDPWAHLAMGIGRV